MTALMVLEWTGCASGLLGSLLLALNTRASGWGFVAYLVSNAAWIGFALLNGLSGLLLMQLGFTVTSVLGLYRWRHDLPPRRADPACARAHQD